MKPHLRRLLLRPSILLTLLLAGALTLWAVQSVARLVKDRADRTASMASMLPQGALLTIESPDFAALLKSWNDSPEQKAWLSSANFSVFSNSRLFGRLDDARTQFESAAGHADSTLAIDSGFLTQVAGHQSIFAWYDIGRLEFVYISRMTAAQAAATELLRQRSSFAVRQAAGATFYLRRSTDAETGAERTVAFAQLPGAEGALLLLATREDLMASTLALIQQGSASQGSSAAQPLTAEPWYQEASAALPQSALPQSASAPVLHMVLNLDRIVPTSYFHSYWVQQNITEMKGYRSAVADLYRDSSPAGPLFREERALLPRSADPAAAAPSAVPGALAALVPAGVGFYRAVATQDSGAAVTALEEKLLGASEPEQAPSGEAPDPSLTVAAAGSPSDLETRIDTPPPVSAGASNQQLTQAIDTAGLDAMLIASTAAEPTAEQPLWVPVHSVVVLHAASSWRPETLLPALQQSLRGELTTGSLGIEFRPITPSGQGSSGVIYALTGPRPLVVALRQNLFFIADDQALLLAMLRRTAQPAPAPAEPVLSIAGFDHAGQRAPYRQLTSVIDGTNRQPPETPSPGAPETPAFFSQNLGSLSDAFAAMRSEHIVERRDGPNLRQTVTYQWSSP